MTVDFICELLAEWFDSPCNYSPMDEKMFKDNYCESHCGKITDAECWKRYFEKMWADRKTENSSEKPNNCEELDAYRKCVESRSFWDNKHCDGCYFDERCPFDEPKDEPQTIKVGVATDSVTGKVLGVTLDTDCAWGKL